MLLNKERLVKISVQGQIKHPLGGTQRVAFDGSLKAVPAIGGITYNVKVGDCVFDFEADHIEPGVSIKNNDAAESDGLNLFACIGNAARVVTGDAKGAWGVVTGKHGGCEHVIIHFRDEDLVKMKIGDEILVEAYGQGTKLIGNHDILVQNIDPDLLEHLRIGFSENRIQVPVSAIVPSQLMGSGQGAAHSYSGDYDLMTKDPSILKKLELDCLRFGDLVLIEDSDNTVGRGYLPGARTVGIVIHGDCIAHGHGPGITTILCSKSPLIEGIISNNANISSFVFEKTKRLNQL